MSAEGADSAAQVSPIVVTAAVGVAITAIITVSRLTPALGDARHDIAVLTVDDLHEGQLEIAAAILLTLVSAVLWGRVQRAPSRRHLLLFISFCVLAVDNLVTALFTAGFDSLSASGFATWVTAGTGLLGAGLLLLAAWLPDEPLERPRRDVLATAAWATCAVLGIVLVAWLLRARLPDGIESAPSMPTELEYLSAHPALVAGDAMAAACWATAAVLLAVASKRTGDNLTRWLAVASVLSALASLNYALLPTHLLELMHLGDYFFLASVGLLLFAAVREVGAAEAALVDRAVYTERRRIAREMHDGVTQELAFIASQAHVVEGDVMRSDRALGRIRDAVDRALDESRTAIAQLSGPVDDTMARAITTTAQVVSRRTGVNVELALDEAVVVSDELGHALVRITRDALAHATRHGARTALIALEGGDVIELSISTDAAWPGLSPGAQQASELASITERVEGFAGEVRLGRGAEGGTMLEVRVPC